MRRDGSSPSLWQETTPDFISYEPIHGTGHFDVIIAGGGITGLTTGLLLQQAGKKVLIAEARNIGFGTTGGTTAHINTFMDTPYHVMEKKFSEADTALVANSIKAAYDLIHANVETYRIDCGYRMLDGYLFSQDKKQTDELEAIVDSCKKYTVKAGWEEPPQLPFTFEKAAKFPGQATLHPLRYLAGLAKAFEEKGGVLLGDCRVTKVDEGNPHSVESSAGNFTCEYFIYATHIPPGVNLLHFRCAPYRSYAMSFRLKDSTKFPDALVYDMDDPYHYYRLQEIDGISYFIAGGEDHKTGHEENTNACFLRLEAHVRKYFDIESVANRWSSQYFEPTDGLPYIGQLPGHPENMFVATGFGGNGIVYSGVAALTLSERILLGKSDYEEVYDPNRIKLVAGFANFVKQAADVTTHLVRSLFPSEKIKEWADIAPGEARLAKHDGHSVAVYKDEHGEIHLLNSACTHIKCDVAWNSAEKTWDCPCHGSRFSYTGEMLTGPATKDLPRVES